MTQCGTINTKVNFTSNYNIMTYGISSTRLFSGHQTHDDYDLRQYCSTFMSNEQKWLCVHFQYGQVYLYVTELTAPMGNFTIFMTANPVLDAPTIIMHTHDDDLFRRESNHRPCRKEILKKTKYWSKALNTRSWSPVTNKWINTMQ